jgi:putative phosphoesterase
MTRMAILSDIHGNWVALSQVAQVLDQEKVDVVLGLGDYLNLSRGSPAIVEWMKRQEHAYFVRGDNDSWESYERFRHLAREDTEPLYQFVTQLPDRIELEFHGIRFLLQHGYASRPIRERGFTQDAVQETLSRPYLASVVSLHGVDIACFGDYHRPYLELHDDLLLVHPGSVGAPRDQQPWMAKMALLELKGSAVVVTQRGVPFCREAAVQEMRAGFRDDPGPDVWLSRWLGLSSANAEEWCPAFEGLTRNWSKRR